MAKIITENFKIETTNELFSSFENKNATLGANFLTQLQSYDTNNSSIDLSLTNSSGARHDSAIKTLVDNQLSISRPEANYYIVASTSLASISGVPSISNTQKSKREFQRKVIFGNKIGDTSARYMFYQNSWISGTVYDAFDDTKDVDDMNMFVTIQNDENDYIVFKCIENNNGAPSTVSPQTVIESFATVDYQSIETSDKYIWHYMFTVSSGEADIYKTSDSLPLPSEYGDADVIANAKESISQIAVETTPTGQFNQYLFGEATTIANSSDVLIKSTSVVGDKLNIILGVTNKVGRTLYNDSDAYKYMYFRSASGATQGKLYDVIASTSNNADKEITITLKTSDTISGSSGQLVPKIAVTSSTLEGTRAKAYGIIDQFGTLKRIAFETKGTQYKFATAQVVYPKSLTAPGITTLRVIVSSKGGHGSSPINEMAMSRLAIVTNFTGESDTIPDSNTYTQVGLIKNPTFTDYATGNSSIPASFDNRVVVSVPGNVTSDAVANKYIEQYLRVVDVKDMVDGEKYVINSLGNTSNTEWTDLGVSSGNVKPGQAFTSQNTSAVGSTKTGTVTVVVDNLSDDHDEEIVTAKIHESKVNGANTDIYLVDYYGDFESKLQEGNIRIKNSPNATTATTVSINSTITYGSYDPYTGELLHFIDFSPITRVESRREKVKFTFDF